MPFARTTVKARQANANFNFLFESFSGLTELLSTGAIVTAVTGQSWLGDGNAFRWSADNSAKIRSYTYDGVTVVDSIQEIEVGFGDSQIHWNQFGLIYARVEDSDNYIRGAVVPRSSGGDPFLQIGESVGGTWSELTKPSYTPQLTTATPYNFFMQCDGTTVTLTLKNMAGVTLATASTTTSITSAGLCGVGAFVNNNSTQYVYIDNWIMDS